MAKNSLFSSVLERVAVLALLAGCAPSQRTQAPEKVSVELAPEAELGLAPILSADRYKAMIAEKYGRVPQSISGDITITNNEPASIPFGTFQPTRSGTIDGFRTVRVLRVKVVWIGSVENKWRVKAGTRYIVYDKQGTLSLAEWRRE